jgi:DNA-nicking Smr family endonuclease
MDSSAEIDLHTFAPKDISSVVEEYVRDAHGHGLRLVRLVHGRGRGVQRGIVQAALERHPLVIEFWDDADSHLGATMARLAP